MRGMTGRLGYANIASGGTTAFVVDVLTNRLGGGNCLARAQSRRTG